MSLAALAGHGDPRLVKLWGEETPVIDPKRIAIIGARDIDAGEEINLRKAGVLVMSMEHIDRFGMVAVMQTAIERVGIDTDGIYLSLDLDVIDPKEAPGVGTPVPGGLTQREARLACQLLGETGKLVGMDMVEVNPIFDERNRTAALATELALAALGHRVWDNGFLAETLLMADPLQKGCELYNVRSG